MKRTTVKLPNDLDAKLRHEAARRGSTIADVIREAIEIHAGGAGPRRLIAAKAGRSGRRDTRRAVSRRSSGGSLGNHADRRFRTALRASNMDSPTSIKAFDTVL